MRPILARDWSGARQGVNSVHVHYVQSEHYVHGVTDKLIATLRLPLARAK